MKNLLLFVLIPIVVFLSSCAALFYGNHDLVTIKSNPPGAKVVINDKYTDKVTPCTIKVKKEGFNKQGTGNIMKYDLIQEGYKTYSVNVPNRKYWLYTVDKFTCWALGTIVGTILFTKYYTNPSAIYMNDPRQPKPSLTPGLLGYLGGWPLPRIIDKISGSKYSYKKDIDVILEKDDVKTVIQKEYVYIDSKESNSYTYERKSDVDNNIPQTTSENEYRFALIIGNEDYSSKQKNINTEINVAFAKNDASAFKDYANKVLGIPEQNITFKLDATAGEMGQGIDKITKLIKNTDGKAEIYFYFAGHGLPDEQTKEPYLIPVDVNGSDLSYALKLKDLYSKLTQYPSKNVTVFLDACFSGGARGAGLVAARGVKIKAKDEMLKGNIVVFTASSGDQSSLPYKEKHHGLFTYYLLKELKESDKELTYKQLSNYLSDKIKLNSILINDKEQIPQTNYSIDIQSDWENWKFK